MVCYLYGEHNRQLWVSGKDIIKIIQKCKLLSAGNKWIFPKYW